MRQAHRELAALEGVRADYWDQLDEEQREDLKERLDAARKATLEALGPAYTVVLRVRGSELEVCSLSDARPSFHEHLGYVWTTLVEEAEWILRRVGSVTLQSTGLIPTEGGLRLTDAVEAFLRFTDKPIVAAKEAVTAGLAQACADGLVGIGRGASLSALQARYCRQSVSLDASEDGVWIIPPFTPEPARGGEETPGAGVGAGGPRVAGEIGSGTTTGETSETATGVTPAAKGTVRRLVVRGGVPVENWSELFRCFVGPAARMNLKKLGLGVQFEMVLPDDRPLSADDPAVKTMKEAARQLGLEFEIDRL